MFSDTPLRFMSPCGPVDALLTDAKLAPRQGPEIAGIHIWILSLKTKVMFTTLFEHNL